MVEETKAPEAEEAKQAKESSGALADVNPQPEQEQEVEKPKKRFSQFDGEGEEYVRKLEDAYASSTTEGQRLAQLAKEKELEVETIAKIVQSDPVLKAKFSDKLYADDTNDYDDDTELNAQTIAQIVKQTIREELPSQLENTPALKKMDDDRKKQDLDVFNAFAADHPEIKTDPALAAELEETFGIIAQRNQSKDGVVDFKKTLTQAWKVVTSEQEVESAKQMLRKESASMSDTASVARETERKTELTDAEKFIADKFGLSEEKYLAGKDKSAASKHIKIN